MSGWSSSSHNDAKVFCHNCGNLGHKAANCRQQRAYSSTVKCYGCGQQVVSLREHKPQCHGKSRTTVECFGCGRQVENLRSHKKKCRGGKGAAEQRKLQIKQQAKADTRDFYLLLDVSSSMQGRRLQDAKRTLKGLFDVMPEDDRIAIISFDTNAYFKLKPRPVGQIRRQNELDSCLSRIFARGCTAVWDAIHMGVTQVRDKTRRTLFIVLTDGEDNSSKHSAPECEELVMQYPAISFNIVHISGYGARNAQYEHLVRRAGTGVYVVVGEEQVENSMQAIFHAYYNAAPAPSLEPSSEASAPPLE